MGRFLSVETFDVSANGTQTAPVLFVTEPSFVLPPSGVPGSVSLRNPPNQTMARRSFYDSGPGAPCLNLMFGVNDQRWHGRYIPASFV